MGEPETTGEPPAWSVVGEKVRGTFEAWTEDPVIGPVGGAMDVELVLLLRKFAGMGGTSSPTEKF